MPGVIEGPHYVQSQEAAFESCFLTPTLTEYDTVLEWPIIGVLSVMLNLYSYALHFRGLVVKNSVYLSSTSISFFFFSSVVFLSCCHS